MQALRDACAVVAERARYVRINLEAIPSYAATLDLAVGASPAPPNPQAHQIGLTDAEHPDRGARREELAAFWLTLNAINFGSGWFPTIRKRPSRSGYFTVAIGLREHFA